LGRHNKLKPFSAQRAGVKTEVDPKNWTTS